MISSSTSTSSTTSITSTTIASSTTISTTTASTTHIHSGKKEVKMTKEEVKSFKKEIMVKHFGENSKDDRVIHFTMSPDHDCVDGVCSDGDFMLTDIPEFAKIHIHSMEAGKHDGIIAEELNLGTTVETYIGVTTESPSQARSLIDDGEDAFIDNTVSDGEFVTQTTDYASTSSLSPKLPSTVTADSTTIMSTIPPSTTPAVSITTKVEESSVTRLDDADDDVALPDILLTTTSQTVEVEITTAPGTAPSTVVTTTTYTTAVTLSEP